MSTMKRKVTNRVNYLQASLWQLKNSAKCNGDRVAIENVLDRVQKLEDWIQATFPEESRKLNARNLSALSSKLGSGDAAAAASDNQADDHF